MSPIGNANLAAESLIGRPAVGSNRRTLQQQDNRNGEMAPIKRVRRAIDGGGDAAPALPRHRWIVPSILALIAGALLLGRLTSPRPPHSTSVAAGFARDISLHHEQAVQMAGIAQARSEDPSVRELATEIARARQAQIEEMQEWLDAWRLSAPAVGPRLAWMGHPVDRSHDMPGMAAPDDTERLERLSPSEMDATILPLLIRHHQGSLEIAQAARATSTRAEVRRLAGVIIGEQQAEISWMQDLLRRRGLPPVEGPLAEVIEHGPPRYDSFAVSAGRTVREAIRLAPITLALFGVAWLLADALRRRRGAPSPKLASAARIWRAVAVGCLLVGAFLQMGLSAEHFDESIASGTILASSSVILTLASAAVVAQPTTAVYAVGVVAALIVMASSVAVRAVWPLTSDPSEPFDLVGVLTVGVGLGTLAVCAAFCWQTRAPRPFRRTASRAERRRARRAASKH